jgi:Pirin
MDMEIVTYVRQGAVTHEDSDGNVSRTAAGDVQVPVIPSTIAMKSPSISSRSGCFPSARRDAALEQPQIPEGGSRRAAHRTGERRPKECGDAADPR